MTDSAFATVAAGGGTRAKAGRMRMAVAVDMRRVPGREMRVAWREIAPIVALGALLRLVNGPHPNDDAFITFRYVRNITDGYGFVYNSGERVLGTTTPLYTLLLAALHAPFGSSIAWLGLGLNTAADCVTIVLLWRLGVIFCGAQRWGYALVAPLLFALSALSVNWCVAAMETSLFTALLIGATWCALTGRARLAEVLAGLAALCRPEGVVLAALLLVLLAVTRRRFPWREAAFAGAVLLPWLVFATLYFGSPLPQSVTAKGGNVYVIAETGLEWFKPFSRVVWDQPLGQLVGLLHLPPTGKKVFAVGLLLTLLFAGLVALGVWRVWRINRAALLVLLAFPVLINALYMLAQTRNVLIFDWYLVPLVPFYLLLLGIGLSQCAESATDRWPRVAGALLTVFVAVAATNALLAYDWGRSRTASPDHYRAAAALLAPRLKPTDTILAPEIGELGWYAPARLFDSIGLVSPDALRFYPVPPGENASNNAIPSRMANELRPEYVVSLELFIRNSLRRNPDFLAHYHLIGKITPTVNGYGSDGLLIYARNDVWP